MKPDTKTKLAKIVRGALIAGGGVALTYFLEGISSLDFGSYSPIVAALAAVLINSVKEWVRKYKP